MYFYDNVHESNFVKLLEKFPQAKNDYQYRVACYITSHPEIYHKVKEQELPMRWAFNIAMGELEVDFSSGFHKLIKLAMNLWNGWNGWLKENGDPDDYSPFNMDDAIGTLDEQNFQVMMQAIRIRRYKENYYQAEQSDPEGGENGKK